jgi:uncharacterized protein YbjQ (UPF0145 family)
VGKCTVCGRDAGLMMSMCSSCIEQTNARVVVEEQGRTESAARLEHDLAQIALTTAPSLEGHRVLKTLDVITSECFCGIDGVQDLLMAITDVFGGRSGAGQTVLRNARKACLRELRNEALSLGANAVIAIHLSYSEFSGAGKSMLFLVASGTAVMVEPSMPSV